MRSEDDVGVEVGVNGDSVFMTIDDVICIGVFVFWGIVIRYCIRYVTVIRLLLVIDL